ncbi:MAG: YhcH/YjgK/YiaL family protein [Phycisphaerales bacterium]|nr:YhcH/YjgK/YiaL family protein [Phycisphaerales bacterium]
MIIDTLQNAHKYFKIHTLFKKAFEYINQIDVAHVATGKNDIAAGLKSIISTAEAKTAEESLKEFECHDDHIDIHLCIKGIETFGWKPHEKCLHPNGDYDALKDVRFFYDAPDMFFKLTEGQFVILFPEDVHAPMIGEGIIKKLVIKVKI